MSVFGVILVRICPHLDQNNFEYGHFHAVIHILFYKKPVDEKTRVDRNCFNLDFKTCLLVYLVYAQALHNSCIIVLFVLLHAHFTCRHNSLYFSEAISHQCFISIPPEKSEKTWFSNVLRGWSDWICKDRSIFCFISFP